MFALTALTLLLVSISNINAAVTPTSPESATSVKIGQPLTATWSADMTGTWTDMTVQLMTGDNLAVSLGARFGVVGVFGWSGV